MRRLIEQVLALLRRGQPPAGHDEAYLGEAADFCDVERRMHELQARSRAASGPATRCGVVQMGR
jgi:hypothetical protein